MKRGSIVLALALGFAAQAGCKSEPTKEQAQQCIDRINSRAANAPVVHVGDARILDEPY